LLAFLASQWQILQKPDCDSSAGACGTVSSTKPESVRRRGTVHVQINSIACTPSRPMQKITKQLVAISTETHDVAIDLIYASANNFTGQVIYSDPLCFLRPQAEACLRKAAVAARRFGFQLRVLDAFRPQEAQEVLWAVAPLPGYVADPAEGSNHTRGVAVDLTLIDSDGQALDMGTEVDTMTARSHHFHAGLASPIQVNRMYLLTIMLEAGFVHHPNEWWHYELPDAKRFQLIDSHALMYGLPAAGASASA
jgi:zinc D-Ala-D-Ala dipeptidase